MGGLLGVPVLTGTGSMAAGSTVTLAQTGGFPFATSWLVLARNRRSACSRLRRVATCSRTTLPASLKDVARAPSPSLPVSSTGTSEAARAARLP